MDNIPSSQLGCDNDRKPLQLPLMKGQSTCVCYFLCVLFSVLSIFI